MGIEAICGIITGIFSALGAAIGFYIKFSKRMKQKREQKRQRNETIERIPKMFEYLSHKIDDVSDHQENIKEDMADLRASHEKFQDTFDNFETQQLRYMINDSFFGYANIHEVPDEQLYTAAECCDIYLAKGLNHATGAKCKLIAAEIERRQEIRSEGDKHGN